MRLLSAWGLSTLRHVAYLLFYSSTLLNILIFVFSFNSFINNTLFDLQLGQALSTRPDILPSIYCQELSKLQVGNLSFFQIIHMTLLE